MRKVARDGQQSGQLTKECSKVVPLRAMWRRVRRIAFHGVEGLVIGHHDDDVRRDPSLTPL